MLLSALDLTPIPKGFSATDALRNSIDLAQHAERLGLHRYWLAEHHNAGALGSSAPEILIATIAAATSRIRVGSGGIMLPNHAPLKVAETFKVLSALHPGRIDLGLGRAAGTDPKTALALRRSPSLAGAEAFPEQLAELMDWLTLEPDPAARFGPTKAIPLGVPSPPLFILGSGSESAALAGRLGLGYAYAQHIAGEGGAAEAIATYRRSFQRSRWGAAPWTILAVSIICSATASDAADFVRTAEVAMLRFGQGLRDLPMPSVEEARRYEFDADEDALRKGVEERLFAGTPETVQSKLEPLLARTSPDELMVTTYIHDHTERCRSYERLVRAFGTA